jgi:nucleotide-binding universal stress UspA family protein
MSSGVVVGYDGSDCAKHAVGVAAELAKTYGETLVISSAYQLHRVGGEVGDYHQALEDLALSRLQEAAALVAESGVDVEAVIMEESPASALIELADKRDARVIVVGTRGESPLHAALIGSTPQKLVSMSQRPVLVVPLPS